MIILRLALKSLANRWLTALLTIFSIALSVVLLARRRKSRDRRSPKLRGHDLRHRSDRRRAQRQPESAALFRLPDRRTPPTTSPGRATRTSRRARALPGPYRLSLGDSHRGFRVLGTTPDYFEHLPLPARAAARLRVGQAVQRSVRRRASAPMSPRDLGYQDRRHNHRRPRRLAQFRSWSTTTSPSALSGILAKTGTPVDRTVHVSLEAIEAIHVDWQSGARIPGHSVSAEDVRKHEPKAEGDYGGLHRR